MTNLSSSKKSNKYYYGDSEAILRLTKFKNNSKKQSKVNVFKYQARVNSLEKSRMRKNILLSLSGLALFLAACASVA